jgi:isopenicillin N synthase-like dioxygenase
MHTTSISIAAAEALVTPSVDLTLLCSHVAMLVGATARSYDFFQVTNHDIPVGTVESALSVVRAFNEQPLAARSTSYSVSTTRPTTYTTVHRSIPPRNA